MNTLIDQLGGVPLLAHMVQNVPIMVKIMFWVFLILLAIGGIGWRENALYVRANGLVWCILFAILGYVAFGF